jgi:hypothetical protein
MQVVPLKEGSNIPFILKYNITGRFRFPFLGMKHPTASVKVFYIYL